MGTLNKFFSNTHLDFVQMSSVNGFLYQKMVRFGGSFLVFCTLLVTLFGFVNRVCFRIKGDKSYQMNNPSSSKLLLQENKQVGSNNIRVETETEEAESGIIEFKDTKEKNESNENQLPNFSFRFQFTSFEEFAKTCTQIDGVDLVSGPSTSSNQYEFKSLEDSSGFMEKPEVFSFTVKELCASSNNGSFRNKEIIDGGFLWESSFKQENLEAENVDGEKVQNSINGACKEEKSTKLEATTLVEESLFVKGEAFGELNNLPTDFNFKQEAQFLQENEASDLDSDSDSIVSSCKFHESSPLVYSISDDFLSENDFGEAFGHDTSNRNNEEREISEEEMDLDYFENEDSAIREELKKLEESHLQNSNSLGLEVSKQKQEEFGPNDNKPTANVDGSKMSTENSSVPDSEDPNKLETFMEHQDLIEQLKMELKKVRATGLPTILEEDESPKIMEDLQPWKIDDQKLQHADTMSELHKFYKSYRERMRKFDILNYQKMYAIGFLQSKDPLKATTSQSSSSPPLLRNFKLCKPKKTEYDPMIKFMKELHSDLEVVYVGQMCLSWEILHWQYEKALELWESDPYGIQRYNEVAGEFQQFQVLMQRFIENEPFEGPRIQNYIKNRCVLRNLLQVPVIREDYTKDKRKARKKTRDENAITSDMLVEIMEESIRIFWRFIRADKDANIFIRKSRKGGQVEPQEMADLELLAEVQATLQKKEKKLKDMLRSGNCILRKFQKRQEDGSDQVLYFFSQVDMKLVTRVLNMSKITRDQVLWCHNKLSKINFVNRKLHVEPSFSLFAC